MKPVRASTVVITESEVEDIEMNPLRKAAKEAKASMMAARVKKANSEDAVKAVLGNCAGVRDMARLYKAVSWSLLAKFRS